MLAWLADAIMRHGVIEETVRLSDRNDAAALFGSKERIAGCRVVTHEIFRCMSMFTRIGQDMHELMRKRDRQVVNPRRYPYRI